MARYDPEMHHRRSVRLPHYDYAQAGAYFVTICTHGRVCWLGTIQNDSMSLSPSGHIVQSIWDSLPTRFPHIELDAFVIMPNHVHGIITVHTTDNVGARFIAPSTPGGTNDSGTDAKAVGDHEPGSGTTHRVTTPDGTYVSIDGTDTRHHRFGQQTSDRAPTGEGAMNRAPTLNSPTPSRSALMISGQADPTNTPVLGQIVRVFKAAAARQIRQHGLPDFAWQRNYYEHVIRNEQTLAKIREYIVSNSRLWEKDQLHPDNPSRW